MNFIDKIYTNNSRRGKNRLEEYKPTLPDSIGDLYKTTKTENESFDTISEAKKILETSLYGDMRNRLKDVLATQSSHLDTKNLFDDIDDDKITKSIPIAEAVIETNKKSGLDVSKYPYLKDGLTMMYAAGEAGNSREMQKAKKAAYMPLTGNIGDLKAITENAVLKGKSLAEPMKTEMLIHTPGKDGDAGMTLYSEKVGDRDGEDIVKQISNTNKVSSKSISTQDADAVYNRARSGAYSITAEDRAILTGMMNDSSTPITKKKEIKSILSRESAKIKPLDEETRKNSKPVERKEAEHEKDLDEKVEELETTLGVATLVPGIDTAADLLSIPIDSLKGDWVSVGLDALGAVPVVGELADSVKTAKFVDATNDMAKMAKHTGIITSNLNPTHMPTLSKKKYSELLDDIRKNGIKEPIKYVEHNGEKYVVDGHHRLKAAKELGIKNVPAEKVELPYKGYKTTDDILWSE